MKYIILEHHPNDSRLTIVNDGIPIGKVNLYDVVTFWTF